MNDPSEPDREEVRQAALLRGLQDDAPPPNAEFLASLREQSLAAFAEQAAEGSAAGSPDSSLSVSIKNRKKPMFTLALRGWALVAATAAAAVVWFNVSPPPEVSGASFSTVLAKLHSARSLELRITQDGRTSEVRVRAPGLVRWDDAPGRYRIAAGSRLWKIDEPNNTVTSGDSPWFATADQPVDLLKLLADDVTDTAPLRGAIPSGRAQYDGVDCLVYRAPLSTGRGRLAIEAFVDPGTNQLRGIVARHEGAEAAAGPPLAELQLVAVNPQVDDAKFVVSKSLTEDGRIGKISDAQGIVGLRPMLARRWTPVYRETPLKPGDWVRTDIRGANAVRVRFSSEVELTLGPGSLLECISPRQARLHTGELQVHIPRREEAKESAAFELLAPRAAGEKFAAMGKTFLRLDRAEQFVKLDDPKVWPKWLAGFEGTAPQESLGSLVVNLPDGRNEPLTVGYHKVSVEIRDQIARTTIEESFVNHTDTRLEGVFHFPLPADASISGFGMWIGDELVEADVVEKQRAREIYETILRERRDPGLLEWTSGNLFKARVFPIEPRSEKRVKIVYTQVLPLRGNEYRYTYGLRSDLLRNKPVRELTLAVTIDSALPLAKVTCPTHAARTQQAERSAKVEFTAQEYSPDRDFEVVCELGGRQSDVVVIPHRRGDDGYLLVQLMPPGPEGNWRREVLPDGEPLSLVLLCDTSGSMDSEKRKLLAEFVAAVLSALGEKDRFLLAGTDTATRWLDAEPQEATADRIAKAREFLDRRISLGWTDLDQAAAAVLAKAPAGAQVVYIGDGLVTAGDRKPASFVKRFAKRLADHRAAHQDAPLPAFHTVSVGNTYEATVLRGIADAGGGSSRAIAGERSPQAVASELLGELAQPGWRDLAVEFRGVKVAAVYPDRLPNVAAGTQQILVARYLPEGKEQSGEVVVTGKRGTEAVRYAAPIRFPDADEGNSFIPRLWARSHLDHLLAQGNSPAIQDEIIGLSEEFHIMTPLTSLLVLETDADRERFGVKRRYEMRDGERFFQQGRDDASIELARQQMLRAGDWRIGMRRSVLRQLAMLGRDPRILQPHALGLGIHQMQTINESFDIGGGGGSWGFMKSGSGTLVLNSSSTYSGGTIISGGKLGIDKNSFQGVVGSLTLNGGAFDEINGEWDERELLKSVVDFDVAAWDDGMRGLDNAPFGGDETVVRRKARNLNSREELGRKMLGDADDILMWVDASSSMSVVNSPAPLFPEGYTYNGTAGLSAADSYFDDSSGLNFASKRQKSIGGRFDYGAAHSTWLSQLFPPLSGPPAALPRSPDASTWSPEARAVADSLLREESLKKLRGGVAVESVVETFDPVWDRRSGRSGELTLYSPSSWLGKPDVAGGNRIVNYCNEKERGVFSLSFGLGQSRAAVERDRTTFSPLPESWSKTPLYLMYPQATVAVEKAGANQVRLTITHGDSTYVRKLLIDTAKHVVLESQDLSEGKVVTTMRQTDFAEVGGLWWPGKAETSDAEGRLTVRLTYDATALAPEEFSARFQAELAPLSKIQVLHHPLPRLPEARRRVADGSATFEDRIVMALRAAAFQLWDESIEHLDAAEKIATDKPGVPRLRTLLLGLIRRNEEARRRVRDEAAALVARPAVDDLFLAQFLISHDQQTSTPAEQLALVELLRPVFERQPADIEAGTTLRDHLVRIYQTESRSEESLPLLKKQAELRPWETYRQTSYAQALLAAGRSAEAYAWLDRQLALPVKRNEYDEDTLRSGYVQLLRTETKWEDLLAFTAKWIERKPAGQQAYEHHLEALIYNNRLDEAYDLAERWLKEVCVEGKPAPDALARMNAVVRLSEGYLQSISLRRADDRLYEALAVTARFFMRRTDGLDIVRRILQNSRNADEADRLRAELLRLLESDAAKLPIDLVRFYVEQTLGGRLAFAEPIDGRRQMDASEVPDSVWKSIAERLRTRWEAAPGEGAKGNKEIVRRNELGEALRSIYQARFADTELLPFLRRRIEVAPARWRLEFQNDLFEALLTRPWTDDGEREAFALIGQMSDAPEAGRRLALQVPALHRLVDSMLTARQTAARKRLADQGDMQKLNRTELARKTAEFRTNAQKELAGRLAALAAPLAEKKDSLADWFEIELARLNIWLEKDLDKIAPFCRRKLGDAPPKPNEPLADDTSPAELVERAYGALFRQRALSTLTYLAVRSKADPQLATEVLAYIDAGIATDDDDADAWRQAKVELLIALDRPDDLERTLGDWVRTEAATAPWRRSLAMLVAERGKLDEAIGLFEAAEKHRLLDAADYRRLADWYLARNRRADHDRAVVAIYRQLPEYGLTNLINSIRNARRQTAVGTAPSDADDRVLTAFRALFEKSPQPENYLYLLREQYQADRDVRTLEMLPDAVLGRSPRQIYALLIGVKDRVLYDLRNEAAADAIVARIKTLQAGERSVTDLRALDLLEALVERQSAEVLNQKGPHVDACLAALKRAFARKWEEGEPREMARYLNGLGKLPEAALVDEQIRELKALREAAPAAGRDRLVITGELSKLLFRAYNRKQEALEMFAVELAAYEQAQEGRLPYEDDGVLNDYVELLSDAGRHAAAEAVLLEHLKHPVHDAQRQFLSRRLWHYYNVALERKGEVSLGSGEDLFKALVIFGLREIDAAADENDRREKVVLMTAGFEAARRTKLAGIDKPLEDFAFVQMPRLLRRETNNYGNVAEVPTSTIGQVLGPKAALRYVVERMEGWPQAMEVGWNNSWNQMGSRLSQFRSEAAEKVLPLGELESRVLALAVAELKRDLRQGESRNREMYYLHHGRFWQAKAKDFAAAAEEVYRERKASGRAVAYIAEYLRNGLGLRPRSVEMLLVAHSDGLLDRDSQVRLIDWLHEDNRHAESIPLLEPLVRKQPDEMRHRAQLMRAYFLAKRSEQLAEFIKLTDKHFHSRGLRTDENLAQFAQGASDAGLYQAAVGYFEEAIAARRRRDDVPAMGDTPLSTWHQQLAHAYSQLGKTREAVEAASGAIVCWSARHNERRGAVDSLRDALSAAKDLDAYVKFRDDEAARTGQDSPMVRKMIGEVYVTRSRNDRAIIQFEIARDLQPFDREVSRSLIACYDALGRRDEATRQLLAQIDFDRHDLKLYEELVGRLKDDEAEAERAATSLIEAGPEEAEHHRAAAELRQGQNRWKEAIVHWTEVAELRRLEPTGLLGLAEAQIHERQWDAARGTLDRLQKTEWPTRFQEPLRKVDSLRKSLPK